MKLSDAAFSYTFYLFTFFFLRHQFLATVYLENLIDFKMSFDSIPVAFLILYLSM